MEVLLPLLLTLPPAAGALIGVSIFLGIMVTAITFMVAYSLQNPQMIALAREELAALIFTLMILFFWFSFDAILNSATGGLLAASMGNSSLAGSFTASPSFTGITQSHITLAIASMDVVTQRLINQYKDLYLFEALIGFLSTISFPIASPVPAVNVISFSLAPFTGLTLLSNAHTVVVEAIGYLITLLKAKAFILIFARDAIPLLLLPLGLVMRAVPFYRRTGSSIIAISFAMYFVLPFAMILSNYLIYDLFKPADFLYTPAVASYFGTDRSHTDTEGRIDQGRGGAAAEHLLEQFQAPGVVQSEFDDPNNACSGNSIIHLFCSAGNIISGAFHAIGSFFSTVWAMWRFMVGMTGDFFFTILNNPAMPASASAGLFFFVVNEVAMISPYVILITLTTVLEIIITVTTYRSVSLLIGGEAEIVGLSKVV